MWGVGQKSNKEGEDVFFFRISVIKKEVGPFRKKKTLLFIEQLLVKFQNSLTSIQHNEWKMGTLVHK